MAKPTQGPESEFRLFHGEMDYAKYTPVFNTRLEAEMNNTRLNLPRRCAAWALRYAWGNHCRYICRRESANSKPFRTAADCARELKDEEGKPLNYRSVANYFSCEIRENRMRTEGHVLILLCDPGNLNAQFTLSKPVIPYKDFLATWRTNHPDLAGKLDEARAVVDHIRHGILGAYREATRSAVKVTGSSEAAVGASGNSDGARDNLSHAPVAPVALVTPPEPFDYTLNSKQLNKKDILSSSSSLSSDAAAREEEEENKSLYKTFKTQYPAGRFDEPKTKPAFEKKSRAEQRHILERLRVYLDSDRWKDDDGKWIPLSSTWLASYEADPPPALNIEKTKSAKLSAKLAEEAEMARRIAARGAEDRKWR